MSFGADACIEMEMESYLYHERQTGAYQRRLDLLKSGVWETNSGKIRIAKMGVSHIQNAVNMLRRYAENAESDAQEMFVKSAIPIMQAELKRRGAT